uniref:Rab-GAP TBC domain-containing protein n=1 Tax=Romanomermis culicivorax TaxID=13658 RepID=A0A915I0G6_ROMCU
MYDSSGGSMVVALLAGPCALEYSKAQTNAFYPADPPADELLQRQRIHSRSASKLNIFMRKSPRLTLQVKRTESLGPDEVSQKVSAFARDYVTSLHQNPSSTLLYGKNNVHVYPVNGSGKRMKGYLSLHRTGDETIMIKWMPNELMHSKSDHSERDFTDAGYFWNQALCVDVHELVYMHVHSKGLEGGGSIVFIGADGVQHPPLHFPPGQHPLAFISSIETSIQPWGHLVPPLWIQSGFGKVFPRLKFRTPDLNVPKTLPNGLNDAISPSINNDYVFRIVSFRKPELQKFDPKTPVAPLSSENEDAKFSSFERFSHHIRNKWRGTFSLTSTPSTSPPTTPGHACFGAVTPDSGSVYIVDSPPLTPNRKHSAPSDDHREIGGVQVAPSNGARAYFNSSPSPRFRTQISSPGHLMSSDRISPPDTPARATLKIACDSMRQQILSRAFYGWLAHCKNINTIRTHLKGMINVDLKNYKFQITNAHEQNFDPLSNYEWENFRAKRFEESSLNDCCSSIYFGGIKASLRSQVWPFLLGFFRWSDDDTTIGENFKKAAEKYELGVIEWSAIDAIVTEQDREAYNACIEKNKENIINGELKRVCEEISNNLEDVKIDNAPFPPSKFSSSSCIAEPANEHENDAEHFIEHGEKHSSMILSLSPSIKGASCSKDLVDLFAVNVHRIDKDVHRCDRNHPYFAKKENLVKLRNVMCTYVWEHLEMGYIQGMCDIAAPLLFVFDDEVLTYEGFVLLMARLLPNFPHGDGMEINFVCLRSLLQVMDPELFDLMERNGDSNHFYFCYRWFLLDFKRELMYDDIFYVWEVIWAASRVASSHFVLFIALATIETYRDVLLDNNMDFTDIIRFFNVLFRSQAYAVTWRKGASFAAMTMLLTNEDTK